MAAISPSTLPPARSRHEYLSYGYAEGINPKTRNHGNSNDARPPFPPFRRDSAMQKVRLAEDAWNTRDPAQVALACTIDQVRRERSFPKAY
jgi:hypothetical protein